METRQIVERVFDQRLRECPALTEVEMTMRGIEDEVRRQCPTWPDMTTQAGIEWRKVHTMKSIERAVAQMVKDGSIARAVREFRIGANRNRIVRRAIFTMARQA